MTRYSHRYFLGSVTYDVNDSHRAAVFYLIGGGGWVLVRDKPVPYAFGEGEFVRGAGSRFALGERVTLFYGVPRRQIGVSIGDGGLGIPPEKTPLTLQ